VSDRVTLLGHWCATGLVYADAGDVPIRVCEVSGVVVDVVDAALRAAAGVIVTGPIATEGQVDDNVVRTELATDRAVIVDKVCVWLAPMSRINLTSTTANISWYGWIIPRPEPQIDEIVRPFHSVPSSTNAVQAVAVVAGLVDLN